jgi:hypothetical protein
MFGEKNKSIEKLNIEHSFLFGRALQLIGFSNIPEVAEINGVFPLCWILKRLTLKTIYGNACLT